MFRGTPKNPPERYRRDHAKAGARDNASTGDDVTRYYSTFAKEDLETIVSSTPTCSSTCRSPRPISRPKRGRFSANTTRTARSPSRSSSRFSASASTRRTPTSTRRWASSSDVENMPNEYAYSKVFFERWYRPQYTTVIIAGDVTPERVLPLVEKYWGGWKTSGTAAARDPEGAGAAAGPLYAHVPWSERDAALGDRRASGTRLRRERQGFGGGRHAGRAGVRADVRSLQEAGHHGAESGPAVRGRPGELRSGALHRVRAGEERRRRGYVRDRDPRDVREVAAGGIVSEPTGLDAAKSNSRYSFARTIDSTERVAAVLSTYTALQALLPDGQQLLSNAQLADVAGPDGDGQRRYFTDSGLDRDDVLKGSAAARHRAGPVARIVRRLRAPRTPQAGARGARGNATAPADVPPAEALDADRSCCRSPRRLRTQRQDPLQPPAPRTIRPERKVWRR